MHGNLDKINEADWKFFGMSHKMFKLLLLVTFTGVIIIVFNLMYSSYYHTHPFVPADSVLREANVNTEGELVTTFGVYLLENIIALALLLPYSFRRNYWSRLGLIQILFGGWMIVLLYGNFAGISDSDLYRLNIFGVLLINALIFILLISSIIADRRNHYNYGYF